MQNLPTEVFGSPSDFGVDMGDNGSPDGAEVDLIDPQLLAGVPAVIVAVGVGGQPGGGAGAACLLYTSPSPRDQRGTRMPSSA